jgi:glycosidase
MRTALASFGLIAAMFTSCSPADTAPAAGADSTPGAAAAGAPVTSVAHPEWTRNAVIYEVNIRQYTPEGTFAAFSTHLPRLKALGVDILWIMPVQPIGKLKRKGTLGSYYSISDYTAANPEFGTVADFKAMVDAAHAQGLKVILDWVANHTSFDHEWTVAHKDWYTLRADGSISIAIDDKGKETGWDDVADLNYGNAAMRKAMLGEMRWWVDSTGIDGFRCDVAGFVPHDFWAEVRAEFRSTHPDLFFLAEWEDPKLHLRCDVRLGPVPPDERCGIREEASH